MRSLDISAPAGVPFIDFRREFDAPRDLVFRAWTDPALLVQWLGPRGMTMVIDEYDVRDGGRYRYVHRDAEGTEYAFHGVFHGPQTPDAMVQTFEFEGAPGHVSLDSLVIEDIGGGRSLVRGHSVHQSVEARDAMVQGGMETGLSEGFERLDEVLGALAARGA